MAAVGVFSADPGFSALVVTEFNPDHDDDERSLARRLVDGLVAALSKRGIASERRKGLLDADESA